MPGLSTNRWLVCCLMGMALGCSSGKPTGAISADEAIKKKVAAMNRIADEVSKDPNSNDTLVAIDEFTNLFFDPKTHPEEAKSILDTYDKRVRGKLRGETAQQLHLAVDQLRVRR